MAGHLIDSTEMYLRTVLELEEEGIPALRARLAERLGLSAPSVSEGVARLESDGLVALDADRTVRLTDDGRELAVHVMRKHRLAERLLVDVIGLEPEHVHEEACRWEHVISDRVEDKLVELLGNPATSPYGNPIRRPGEVGEDLTPLADAQEGRVTIVRLSELIQAQHDVMHALVHHGVLAGVDADVTQEPTGVRVQVDAADGDGLVLEDDDARLIYVRQHA